MHARLAPSLLRTLRTLPTLPTLPPLPPLAPTRAFSLQGHAAASLLSGRLESLEGDMRGVSIRVVDAGAEEHAHTSKTHPTHPRLPPRPRPRIALLLHADRTPQPISDGTHAHAHTHTRTHFGASLLACSLPAGDEGQGLGSGDLGLLAMRERYGVRVLRGPRADEASFQPYASRASTGSSPLTQLPLPLPVQPIRRSSSSSSSNDAATLDPTQALSFAAHVLSDVEIRQDVRLCARYTLQAALAGVVTELWDLFRECEGVWFSAEVELGGDDSGDDGGGGVVTILAPHLEFDDYALHRASPTLQSLHAAQQQSTQDSNTLRASSGGLFYVKLPGHGRVGSFGYGAGNAMGTMDALAHAGGQPANFLDGGGGATRANARLGIETLGRDADVRAILVNTFGGLTQTDVVAEGILDAVREGGVQLPIVVRILGTGSERAKQTLRAAGLGNITLEDDFKEAARLAVEKSRS